jgi:hypothetical protein
MSRHHLPRSAVLVVAAFLSPLHPSSPGEILVTRYSDVAAKSHFFFVGGPLSGPGEEGMTRPSNELYQETVLLKGAYSRTVDHFPVLEPLMPMDEWVHFSGSLSCV